MVGSCVATLTVFVPKTNERVVKGWMGGCLGGDGDTFFPETKLDGGRFLSQNITHALDNFSTAA